MENIENTINADVKSVTVSIPVRVTMTSVYNAPFDFVSSIDDAGQIILTPTSKDVEFTDANTEYNVEYETPINEQETTVVTDGNITTKCTSIILQANMLVESENVEISADVDSVGQCVIWPSSKENMFVSATISDSLNLITEDTKVVDYFGYKLINNGDGWNIQDYVGELVDEGVATEAEAKVVVLTTELSRLQQLTEDTQQTESETPDAEEVIPEVTAEVIEENYAGVDPETTLRSITHDFRDTSGMIACDSDEELKIVQQFLNMFYNDVSVETIEGRYVVSYADMKDEKKHMYNIKE